ncbi:protein traS [Enterobacter bugandensis]
MKRSDLEKDANLILSSIKGSDYEMPRNRNIMGLIFSKLRYVYLLQVFFIVLDCLLYQRDDGYQLSKAFFLLGLSGVTMLFFTMVFIGATYSNVCIYLILSDKVRRESLLIGIVNQKIDFYSRLLLSVNILIGVFLLWAGEFYIAGLGFSWFVTFIVCGIVLQGSLSRYMTPPVVSSLSKVKEVLSASPR